MAIEDYPNFGFAKVAPQPQTLGQLQERFQGIKGMQGSYSGMMNQCGVPTPQSTSPGNHVLTMASETASRAESIAVRLSDRLSVLAGPEGPRPPSNNVLADVPFPPYLEELHSRLLHINRTLDILESLNERIAL